MNTESFVDTLRMWCYASIDTDKHPASEFQEYRAWIRAEHDRVISELTETQKALGLMTLAAEAERARAEKAREGLAGLVNAIAADFHLTKTGSPDSNQAYLALQEIMRQLENSRRVLADTSPPAYPSTEEVKSDDN
jgi:hypothetical protein